MPFTYTCPSHADVPIDPNEEGVTAHAMTHHPGESVATVAHSIDRAFTSQLAERGLAPLRIMACRVCGSRIETRDPEAVPYCGCVT